MGKSIGAIKVHGLARPRSLIGPFGISGSGTADLFCLDLSASTCQMLPVHACVWLALTAL